MKRILWVDDHEILCVALSEYVQQHAAELSKDSIETTPIFSLQCAIEEVNKHPPPDLVFLDLNLDQTNSGTGTLERFQADNTHRVPVIVCTGLALTDGNVEILRGCLGLGARGIILKGGAYLKMFVGLSRILQGEFFIPEEVVMQFMQPPSPVGQHRDRLGLTPREWDIAVRIGRGLPGKEIARELKLQPGHVRQVSCLIYDKLQVRNRTEAAIRVNAEIATNGQQPPTWYS